MTPFPKEHNILLEYLKYLWTSGCLDEYSKEHFLIKAIENRLVDFKGIEQMINNDFPMYCNKNGKIENEIFCESFCVNFSMKLQNMSSRFGKEKIEKFIRNQLSAGKNKYDESAFFQAMSEIEILCFISSSYTGWKEILYEPSIGKNGKNPEASFVGEFYNNSEENLVEVKINVEVKTPKFSDFPIHKENVIVPSVLLTAEGRKEVKKFCEDNEILYLEPRINTLVEFINSAASKFEIPKENEYNLLYINWSFRDFPSKSLKEAWSLLTNIHNGLLIYPEIGMNLPIKEPIKKEAYDKITAIIVYNSSYEELMFINFTHVWQGIPGDKKFRMWIVDEVLREAEVSGKSNLLNQVTGMKQSSRGTEMLLVDNKDDVQIMRKKYMDILKIISDNILK